MAVHTPVLLEETLACLAPRGEGGLMIDATMGEGGHSKAFLSRFPGLRIAGVDADGNIQAAAREELRQFEGRVCFYNQWSQDFFASYPAELERPDTILIDLGISLFHYERSGRGFSFRKDEPLDMRLDASAGVSAADLVNRTPEAALADLLYVNAGERYSRRIARAMVLARAAAPIRSTAALADIVMGAVPPQYRHGAIHPATKTFQALRAAVNGELARLPELLEAAFAVLKPGGRIGVISFNSAEDRLVKLFMRGKSRGADRALELITPKGVTPSDEEAAANPPSRSARLRAAKKLDEAGAQ